MVTQRIALARLPRVARAAQQRQRLLRRPPAAARPAGAAHDAGLRELHRAPRRRAALLPREHRQHAPGHRRRLRAAGRDHSGHRERDRRRPVRESGGFAVLGAVRGVPGRRAGGRPRAARGGGQGGDRGAGDPGLRRVQGVLRRRVPPAARKSIGATDLPDGQAYYADLVRYFTTLPDATAEKIHETGLAEVARIRAEMEAIVQEVGFQGSFDEFLVFLRTDPQFYAKTPEQLLCARRLDHARDRRPHAGVLRRHSARALHREARARGARAQLHGRPLQPGPARRGRRVLGQHVRAAEPAALRAAGAHAARGGARPPHAGIALARELENVPVFRRNFYPHAFGEGWGLYSEYLGVEMGVYHTPYERFGRLTYEMWRACRLVVDTGMHAFGWSRQRALDYMKSNTALSEHEIRTEIDRYIAWPGQALAYKTGELRDQGAARARGRAELGAALRRARLPRRGAGAGRRDAAGPRRSRSTRTSRAREARERARRIRPAARAGGPARARHRRASNRAASSSSWPTGSARRSRRAALLAIEAGTGTGKTFAYLVPALLSGRQVIISTGTRTLQDQLFNRDLPTVATALGRPARIALLKGRANYLCLHRLELAESMPPLPGIPAPNARMLGAHPPLVARDDDRRPGRGRGPARQRSGARGRDLDARELPRHRVSAPSGAATWSPRGAKRRRRTSSS